MKIATTLSASLLVMAVLTGSIATQAAVDEYSAMRHTKSGPNAAFLQLRQLQNISVSPWSIRSQSALLEMCNDGLISPLSTAVARETYRHAATQCGAYAMRVIRTNPTWGLAWFTAARAAWASGDNVAAHDALARSTHLAPNEGWLAQKRVLLALDLPHSDAIAAGLEHDLTVLLSDKTTRAWLAELVAVHPTAHLSITSNIDAIPRASRPSGGM
ncbi:hypothetical protein [Celeribacter marinus]|uniref:hypothetical protein n=1 Tax=Celeribacter marinus TaxID=1397108 RepID=UPI003F6B55AC